MSEDLDSISEEERSLFRPFTRESLAAIEARIAEEHAKQKEIEKKRAEGEVIPIYNTSTQFVFDTCVYRRVQTLECSVYKSTLSAYFRQRDRSIQYFWYLLHYLLHTITHEDRSRQQAQQNSL